MFNLFLHELHSAHLELVNGGHVDLWQIVGLVARVDIFGDGLRLLEDENFAIICRLMTVNGTGRFLETILHLLFIAPLRTRSVFICE